MKFIKATRFVSGDVAIEFRATKGYPGFTHTVLVIKNNTLVARDLFDRGGGTTMDRAVKFYAEKHAAKIAA